MQKARGRGAVAVSSAHARAQLAHARQAPFPHRKPELPEPEHRHRLLLRYAAASPGHELLPKRGLLAPVLLSDRRVRELEQRELQVRVDGHSPHLKPLGREDGVGVDPQIHGVLGDVRRRDDLPHSVSAISISCSCNIYIVNKPINTVSLSQFIIFCF